MMIKTHIAGIFLKLFFEIMKGYPLFYITDTTVHYIKAMEITIDEDYHEIIIEPTKVSVDIDNVVKEMSINEL